jgi:hypothetical protein
MYHRGKAHGIWTAGQEVRTVRGVVFIGRNTFTDDPDATVPSYSWARDAASRVAREALNACWRARAPASARTRGCQPHYRPRHGQPQRPRRRVRGLNPAAEIIGPGAMPRARSRTAPGPTSPAASRSATWRHVMRTGMTRARLPRDRDCQTLPLCLVLTVKTARVDQITTRTTALPGRLPRQKNPAMTDPSTGHDRTPGANSAGPYRTKTGKILTAEHLDALVAEAERGYPLGQLRAAARRPAPQQAEDAPG